MIKILSVSDTVDPKIYSSSLGQLYGDIDLVIGCGDLPFLYLEYILTILNRPLFFVHGNHDPDLEYDEGQPRPYPMGGDNLHRRIIRNSDLLLAGVEGSILYNNKSTYQYSQSQMWLHVASLVPGLLINKIRYGRFLDIFVTHAPPRGIHEGEDWTHQGIDAFRWLIRWFQPAYHFHGHIHIYRPDEITETTLGRTMVINTYKSKITEIKHPLA